MKRRSPRVEVASLGSVVAELILFTTLLHPLMATFPVHVLADPGWVVETVDRGEGDVGLYSSIAIDSNGNPHISYFDETCGTVKYARFTGTQWEMETIERVDYATMQGFGWIEFHTSIALDSSDHPHISYNLAFVNPSEGHLRYAEWTGSAWSIQTVDSRGSSGYAEHSSLDLDSTDKPHISYRGEGEIMYAHWTGSNWDIETVGPETPDSTSLVVDSEDNPHILYCDRDNNYLLYARKISDTWVTEAVDSDSDNEFSSFDLDNYDNPHVVFSNHAPSFIGFTYATKTEGSWDYEPIDTAPDTSIDRNSLVLDSSNIPHICYVSYTTGVGYALRYATLNGATWDTDILVTSPDSFDYPSIALSQVNHPSISYAFDAEKVGRNFGYNYCLSYVAWTGTLWNNEIVDAGQGKVGKYSSMVIDSNDYKHISYYDEYHGDVKYAYGTIGDWELDVADEIFSINMGTVHYDDVGQWTSIALDSSEQPHLSYTAPSPDYGYHKLVRYAHRDGAVWDAETIPHYQNGDYTSIALDQNDDPRISFFRGSGGYANYELAYAIWTGTDWSFEVVDSGGTGWYSSLVFDGSYNPHIGYYDSTNKDLKYARWTGTEWHTEFVDTVEDVGSHTSLALDGSSNPHISYYDYTNEDLKYARWTGTEWQIEVVDSEGNVGTYTSIALDSADVPYISYYDDTNKDLKITTYGVNDPPVADSNGPYTGTEGTPVTFDASGSYDLDGTIVLYEWDWNSDTVYDESSVTPTTSHTWGDDASATITLRVTDNKGETDTDTTSVTVTNVPPLADAGSDFKVNEGEAASFSGAFTDPGWLDTHTGEWDFAGLGTSTLQNPKFTFMDDGVYTVTLTMTDDDGGVGQDVLEAIVLDLAPMAEFNWSPEPQDEGSPIQFNDLSTSFPDTIVSWSWNFAGLGSSADPNPTFAFTDDGVHAVSLTVTDEDGSTDTVRHDVTVVALGPTAAFTWSPEPQNEGSPIQFTDESTSHPNTIVSWSWDFAGLGASSLQNPKFTFMDDGFYTVYLTVTDDDGSTDTVSHDVTVVDLGPTAAFTWSPEPQNEGSPIQFTDLSTSYPDTIVSWSWDFAGLGILTLQNPKFAFMDDGVYTVTLTVTDHDGSIDMINHDVTVSPNIATIIVEKKVEWGIDSQYVNHPVFEITLGPQIQFWLGPGEPQTFELEAGTYSISEESGGWSTRVLVHGGSIDYEIEGCSVDVKIEKGETITVTFVNRPPDFVIPETTLGTIASLAIMLIIYLLQNKRLLFKTH